jgi:hypothetical protein
LISEVVFISLQHYFFSTTKMGSCHCKSTRVDAIHVNITKLEPEQADQIKKSDIAGCTILENVSDYYEFQKVLGHGGFGIVRRAVNI